MNKEIAKRIEQLAVELTEELSIVETPGELDSTKKVYDIFSNMDYYKEHPEHLYYVHIPNDKLGRKSLIAILKGKRGNSRKTVLMIGHTDTVGISDYGSLKEYANKPYELTEKFKEVIHTLSDDVKKDLESGNYLFGRGLFDMKTGNAIIIALMEEISKGINEFDGNLIYSAVCDEEGNSYGMISVIPELVKIKEKENLDYVALLDTDYMTSEYEGDENKYIYIGTVGKLMPSFYIVGKETHVGEAFKGIDPNQIAASITNKVNLNTDFCDIVEGEVTLPPITLRQRDLKSEYSVQSTKTANLFFNYSTHCSTPDEVLLKMKCSATEAFQSTIDNLNTQYERFCLISNRHYQKLPWKPRVITYEELCDNVKAEMGEKYEDEITKINNELINDETLDQRDYSLKMVEEVYNLWSDRDPVIILYLTPPYYPHIYVEGNVPKEKKLLDSVKNAIESTDTDYKLIFKKFFPYISDLSYAAAPKDLKVISSLKNNMPGFGSKYYLPIDEMQKLDLPVLDIGPYGKDAHKFTERIEKKYSFEVAPILVYKTIMNLLKD